MRFIDLQKKVHLSMLAISFIKSFMSFILFNCSADAIHTLSFYKITFYFYSPIVRQNWIICKNYDILVIHSNIQGCSYTKNKPAIKYSFLLIFILILNFFTGADFMFLINNSFDFMSNVTTLVDFAGIVGAVGSALSI